MINKEELRSCHRLEETEEKQLNRYGALDCNLQQEKKKKRHLGKTGEIQMISGI